MCAQCPRGGPSSWWSVAAAPALAGALDFPSVKAFGRAVKTLGLNSFAATALSQAREVYKEHGLLGYLKGR